MKKSLATTSCLVKSTRAVNMHDLSRRLAVSNVVDFPRRLIGFHMEMLEPPTFDAVFHMKSGSFELPIAVMSTARRTAKGFEIMLGRASGCIPGEPITAVRVTSNGVDLPSGQELSLWAFPCHGWGTVQVELLWTYR